MPAPGAPGTLERMDLAFRELGGQGAPVVFLHGLFGSSQNWAGMGRRLSQAGRMLAVDLRNHGSSPHAEPHSLAACVEDLAAWAGQHAPGRLRLIGHSMGGLVAMSFALHHPERTAGVAAVDIAPRVYPPGHQKELAALRMDLSGCQSRADLDGLLARVVPDERTRQFLLTNAVREGDTFRWRIDAEVLSRSTVARDFAGETAPPNARCEALLVASGASSYVGPGDPQVMRRWFPTALVETLPAADHWPHISAPEELAALLAGFLERCNKRSALSSGMV